MDSCSPRWRRRARRARPRPPTPSWSSTTRRSGLTARTTWIRCCNLPPALRLALIGETPVNFDSHLRAGQVPRGRRRGPVHLPPVECPLGGDLEFTVGGRYLELKDQFWVDARGGNLTDSYWNTTSHNEIAGPEIGVRYYQPYRAVRHFGRGPLHGGHQRPVGPPGRPPGLRIDRRPEYDRSGSPR